MKIKPFVLVGLLSVLMVSWLIIRYVKKENYPGLPELTSLSGEKFDPTVLEDKVHIISYFQTWCSDCLKEKPQLEALMDHYGKENIEIVCISDEPIGKLQKFQELFPSKLSIYHSGKSLKKQVGIRAFPTTYLFGKNGRVLRKTIEGMDWGSDKVYKLLDKEFGY